jgi:ABC-type phosphate/phosphonate transport system ATPase subunit
MITIINLLLRKDHKSLVQQNHECKSTLLRTIDECCIDNNGVLMLNVHKLDITNKKIKTKQKNKK